jgi:hypothetical protein
MATRTILTTEIPQRTTPILAATFVDEAAATITSFTTVTMTLYDLDTGKVINGNTATDVSASVTAGVLALTLAAADTAMLDSSKARERHVALFEFTWGSGRAGKHEITMDVVNLEKVA